MDRTTPYMVLISIGRAGRYHVARGFGRHNARRCAGVNKFARRALALACRQVDIGLDSWNAEAIKVATSAGVAAAEIGLIASGRSKRDRKFSGDGFHCRPVADISFVSGTLV